MTFLITGGAGFIGSHFAELLHSMSHRVIVLDALTYAGSGDNIPPGVSFIHGSICSADLVRHVIGDCDAVFNFAAESHVCRSILDSDAFVESNVRGTQVLLKESLKYWQTKGKPKEFRYVQISTDEVFGDLGPDDEPFNELSPLQPHSPYSASKCAADCFVAAFHHTYGLPTIVTRCSNNYGSRQHPEKLIPAAVTAFLRGEPFTLHGDGSNVRDWLAVEDHCRGILAAYESGRAGETYCFGGNCERSNLEVVRNIASMLERRGDDYITFGCDRPGNDRRYAIDFSRASRELGWRPEVTFEEGLRRTVEWYVAAFRKGAG